MAVSAARDLTIKARQTQQYDTAYPSIRVRVTNASKVPSLANNTAFTSFNGVISIRDDQSPQEQAASLLFEMFNVILIPKFKQYHEAVKRQLIERRKAGDLLENLDVERRQFGDDIERIECENFDAYVNLLKEWNASEHNRSSPIPIPLVQWSTVEEAIAFHRSKGHTVQYEEQFDDIVSSVKAQYPLRPEAISIPRPATPIYFTLENSLVEATSAYIHPEWHRFFSTSSELASSESPLPSPISPTAFDRDLFDESSSSSPTSATVSPSHSPSSPISACNS